MHTSKAPSPVKHYKRGMVKQIEQLISELNSIEQDHINGNPTYFRTKEFINRLIDRLNEITNND